MVNRLYAELAGKVGAYNNCANRLAKVSDDESAREWMRRHAANIAGLAKEYLPHGSGFNAGSTVDLYASTSSKLVIHTSFHHMDENGGYDGWTEHTVTVTPSLAHGFDTRISGPNRNDVKEYMYQVFQDALNEWVPVGDVNDVANAADNTRIIVERYFRSGPDGSSGQYQHGVEVRHCTSTKVLHSWRMGLIDAECLARALRDVMARPSTFNETVAADGTVTVEPPKP